ncbi:alpha/beta hydrolase [Deinococcus metallilatus]|uniref:Alpha/beta hydrolase n=1 Tax=Deinococcus metallilatus TaxID=1211322 RepID=A0AAJ5K405_9DEIO|nr:alpha/beta hydrolase [Deinococcus metallilatus]MBB5296768.1 pimeloyl-ACP methyl ester carboxylesterase [Deinococcus metallilatus]QBY09162.1 alpha/beta hydrolase [Deinococcus metallilatus]RXJ09677.1 alpha/beta hydrolase [Deinococcus metallilatus]TLK24143.1 alpha/beta hydrolase [Deinococcus metallilatus]GMA13799.1 alpha/beta hydrolase [Deinococcus metallilatus]
MPERVLVAIHGNFASAAWWVDLLADPPTGWRVLAPDLPGFAGTAHAGEVSIPAYADWLAAWLAEREITRPVLLGHSLGGAVALEFAARDPHHLSGLILAASAPLTGLVTPEENYPVLELLRVNGQLRELSLGALFPSGSPANFPELVADAGRMADSHYSGNARALAGWRVDAARIKGLPVLVLGGELDTLITPEMVRAQAAALGTSAAVLEGRGHGFPQEDPGAFRALISEFLATLP